MEPEQHDQQKLPLHLYIIKDPKARNITILIILIIALFFVIISKVTPEKFVDTKIRMCPKCDKPYKLQVTEGVEAKCPNCQQELTFAYKCMDCEYEFSYKEEPLSENLTLKQRREQRINAKICPNCKSESTYNISVVDYDEEQERKRKEAEALKSKK